MLKKITTPHKAAFRVAIAYLIFSLAWITFSDQLILSFSNNIEILSTMQTSKGWLFAVISALLLYALFSKELSFRSQVEELLFEKKNLLSGVLNSTDNAILALDKNRKVTYFNDQYLKIAPFKKDFLDTCPTIEEVLREFCAAGLYPQDEIEKFIARRMQQMKKAGNIVFIETPFLDGRIVEGFCNKLPDEGYVLTFRDVTERKRLMEENTRSSQLQALGTLAAGVAHEINNPISGIINYATLLQRSPNKVDRIQDISRRIITEGERIAGLAQDMLNHSKKTSKEKSLSDIHVLIESSLALVRPKVYRKNIDIKTEYTANLPRVEVNPQRFQQVIIILIDNAYDATRTKKTSDKEKVIHVRTKLLKTRQGRQVCIEVYDKGVGMTEQTLKHAKDTFFTTKPATEGTGLGLSIASEIVEDLGGRFDLESKKDEFTKAKIYIPVPA